MKKLLAILCAVALVATCCAVSFTAFADDTAATSPALYNFTTKAETDKWVGLRILEFNGNTKFEYDAEQQALKVSPKDITATKACQFTIGMANKTTNVADYPVIALKVKANNRTRNTCGIWPGTKVEGRSIYSCGDVCTFYDRTGNWDLIIYDGSKANLAGYEGIWDSIIVRLMGDNDVPNDTDYTWIQWAGVFKSVEEVYAYDTSMAPSPFFYDFRNETDGQNLIADGRVYSDGNTNTAISYDTNEKAVKIASKGTNANRFFFDSKINSTRGATVADVTKYPVFAMKVKFSNPNLNFGGIVPGTCSTAGELCGYVATDAVETGAYQLIVWDGSSYSHNRWNNAWKRVLGALAPNGTTPTTDDCMWVQWAGVFESVEDAYAYDTDCASPFFFNYEDQTDVQKLMAKNYVKVENNVSLSYNATEKALEINPTDVGAKSNHRFSVNPLARTTPVADYPVMAIKIKPKNTNHKLGGIAAGTARTGGGSLYASDFQLKGTTLEDDWQIVIFDGTTPPHANYSGNWAGLLISLAPDNSVTTAEDGWYVKWAGAFPSVEAAYAACGDHEYDNACDTTCNICNAERKVGEHVYDNACDADCNICKATRTPSEHVYDNACDADCNICKATRKPSDHVYDNECDTSCNVCKAIREVGDHNHQVDAEASSAATYFVAGKEVKVCEYCGDTVETPLPATDTALKNVTESYANGKLTIVFEYSEALIEDVANGAVISFNYSIAGYTGKAPVENGQLGGTVTIEGFNIDRLNKDVTYFLSAEYAAAEDITKLEKATTKTVKAADVATQDAEFSALLEELNKAESTVISGEVEDTDDFVDSTVKADIKNGTVDLRFVASQKLIDDLAKLDKKDRTVKLHVTVDGIKTVTFELEKLTKVTMLNITGMSFEQLNGKITVQLEFIYTNTEDNFSTEEFVFDCGKVIANTDSELANAFAAYMSK